MYILRGVLPKSLLKLDLNSFKSLIFPSIFEKCRFFISALFGSSFWGFWQQHYKFIAFTERHANGKLSEMYNWGAMAIWSLKNCHFVNICENAEFSLFCLKKSKKVWSGHKIGSTMTRHLCLKDSEDFQSHLSTVMGKNGNFKDFR